jgi:hypothetical protein
MVERVTGGLEPLRTQVSQEQRGLLDWLWAFYCEQGQWPPCRFVHQRRGTAPVQALVAALGEGVVRATADEGRAHYRLTFLGVLLTSQGADCEELLIRYLEYVRGQFRDNPRLEWVTSAEVEGALDLSLDRSRLLRHLLRLSHWWGGGSAFAGREWTVGVPLDVEELLAEADLQAHVREHVLTHFAAETLPGSGAPPAPAGESVRGPFWYVADPDLRRRLAEDWHEAQEVFQVRGFKGCVALCGGILEALLLEALRRAGIPRGGLRTGSLGAALAAAVARGIVGPQTLILSRTLEAFPALIRPGRGRRGRPAVSRREAEDALEAVRICRAHLEARAALGADA